MSSYHKSNKHHSKAYKARKTDRRIVNRALRHRIVTQPFTRTLEQVEANTYNTYKDSAQLGPLGAIVRFFKRLLGGV